MIFSSPSCLYKSIQRTNNLNGKAMGEIKWGLTYTFLGGLLKERSGDPLGPWFHVLCFNTQGYRGRQGLIR